MHGASRMIGTRACGSESHDPTVDPPTHETFVHETVEDRRDRRVGVVWEVACNITNRELTARVIPEDSDNAALEVSQPRHPAVTR